jgi:NAD(P)-dependent dehydrogenase (short-subunit alcohol dehydrogenase family)
VTRSRLAIVTGATAGIGAAVAQSLAAGGMHVLLVGRNPRKLATALRRMPARRRATSLIADLASTEDIARLLGEIAQRCRRLDLLVHCAGEHEWSTPGGLKHVEFDRLFAVNVRAPYLLTQGLLPLLARARGQVVVVNSSIVRGRGTGVAAYKATQHAVQGFTDGLRADLNRRGVRVTSLFPGRTATRRMRRIYAREGKPYRPGLLLSPRDVAQLVLALSHLPPRLEVTDLHLRSLTPY